MNDTRSSTTFICFGEMLWDVLPGGNSPGGAPMNVAYHLCRQGQPAVPVSRIGDDEAGEGLRAFLTSKNVSVAGVQVDSHYATGKVFAHTDNRYEVRYEIVAPVAWDFIAWEGALPALLQGDNCLIFGSLAVRNAASMETLKQALPLAGLRVLDINLRAPHYTQERLEWLLQQCDILKLNETELQLLGEWYVPGGQPSAIITALSERFCIPEIIVTMGGDGATLYRDGQWYRQSSYQVVVADTIGSGDAFLAGYLSQRYRGVALPACLAYAAGLGALVASYAGACPDYDTSAVEALMR